MKGSEDPRFGARSLCGCIGNEQTKSPGRIRGWWRGAGLADGGGGGNGGRGGNEDPDGDVIMLDG